MKFYCISDNVDTAMGMRLAGVEGAVVHERDEVLAELKKALSDDTVGIVLITTKLLRLCSDEVFYHKLNTKRPLIVEIPDRHASAHISENISGYIRDSLGLELKE